MHFSLACSRLLKNLVGHRRTSPESSLTVCIPLIRRKKVFLLPHLVSIYFLSVPLEEKSVSRRGVTPPPPPPRTFALAANISPQFRIFRLSTSNRCQGICSSHGHAKLLLRSARPGHMHSCSVQTFEQEAQAAKLALTFSMLLPLKEDRHPKTILD